MGRKEKNTPAKIITEENYVDIDLRDKYKMLKDIDDLKNRCYTNEHKIFNQISMNEKIRFDIDKINSKVNRFISVSIFVYIVTIAIFIQLLR